MEADLLWWNDSAASGEGTNPKPRHLTRPQLRLFLPLDVRFGKQWVLQHKICKSAETFGDRRWQDRVNRLEKTQLVMCRPAVDWSHCASPNSGCSQHRWLFVVSRCFKEDAERRVTEFQLRVSTVWKSDLLPLPSVACWAACKSTSQYPCDSEAKGTGFEWV